MPDEQPDEPQPTGGPALPLTGGPVPASERALPDEPAMPDERAVPGDVAVRDDGAVPDEETLARIAMPALVRRAPRYGAFIGYGALLGFVLGVVLAIALDRGDLLAAGEGGGVLPFLGGSNGARLVTGFGLAGVGAVVGALLALWADARSRRRAH